MSSFASDLPVIDLGRILNAPRRRPPQRDAIASRSESERTASLDTRRAVGRNNHEVQKTTNDANVADESYDGRVDTLAGTNDDTNDAIDPSTFAALAFGAKEAQDASAEKGGIDCSGMNALELASEKTTAMPTSEECDMDGMPIRHAAAHIVGPKNTCQALEDIEAHEELASELATIGNALDTREEGGTCIDGDRADTALDPENTSFSPLKKRPKHPYESILQAKRTKLTNDNISRPSFQSMKRLHDEKGSAPSTSVSHGSIQPSTPITRPLEKDYCIVRGPCIHPDNQALEKIALRVMLPLLTGKVPNSTSDDYVAAKKIVEQWNAVGGCFLVPNKGGSWNVISDRDTAICSVHEISENQLRPKWQGRLNKLSALMSPQAPELITTPLKTDCCFGPGAFCNPGNKAFQRIVLKMLIPIFRGAIQVPNEDAILAKKAVQIWKDAGGRFLDRNTDGGLWTVISNHDLVVQTIENAIENSWKPSWKKKLGHRIVASASTRCRATRRLVGTQQS